MNSQQTFPRVGLGVVVYDVEKCSILMSRRKDSNMLALPGGHLEFYEEFSECAIRELKEETGLISTEMKFFKVYNIVRKDSKYHYVTIYMTTLNPTDQIPQNLESHKHEDWQWFSADQIDSICKESPQDVFYSLLDAIKDAGGAGPLLQHIYNVLMQ